ncbi:MAG: hypothetical protein GXP06_00210 [Alphaproteobacteria bacterium]|nr:hypothetical protein [Alphaproteobacteria bacterium]
MHQYITNTRHKGVLLASTAVISFLPGLAAAQTNHLCTAWNVERSIEVVTPGDDGALCQVVYRKPDEGVADQTLWRSNRSVAYCEDKAQALATRLSTAGFECAEGELPAQIIPASIVAPVGKPVPVTTPQPEPTTTTSTQATSTSPSGGQLYTRAPGVSDTSWHLAGYADTTFIATSAQGETNAEFSSARFNPVFHFQYKDLVLLEAELEVSIDEDGVRLN